MPRFLNERATTSTTSLSQPGKDLRQGLEDRDLGAEVAHHRGELAADGAAADDDRRRRQLVEHEHLVGGEHDLPVDVEAGDRCGARNPMASMTLAPLSSMPSRDLDPMVPGDSVPVPVQVVILRCFMRPARPFHSWSTTFCLRAWLVAKSTDGWSA